MSDRFTESSQRSPASSRMPNCQKCKHFYITWQNNTPYGCRAFNIWSRRYPSVHVMAASGQVCLYEEPKPPRSAQGK